MTRLATTRPKPKKTAKHTPAGQFQLLWEKIEKQKTRLAGQEKRVRKIVDRFNAEILPLEWEHARSQYQLVERLLTFLSRKSLTRWQRDELCDWIHDELGVLSSNPFADPELDRTGLLVRFESLIKQHYPQPDTPPLTESERENIRSDVYQELGLALDDEDIDLFMHSPADFLQQMMEKMQEGDEDWLEEDEEEEEAGEEADDIFGPGETDGQAAGKALIHRLYKQLAKRLHPDLEPDKTQKAIKHEQMQQLLAARQENDIHTLLELHRQHFDSAALEQLGQQELDGINELLRRQLRELERQYDDVFIDQSLESAIWNRFRHLGSTSSDRKFAEHARELKADIRHNNKLLKQLTTLKDVQQLLRENRALGY